MKTTTRTTAPRVGPRAFAWALATLLALGVGGCERATRVEVRTFALQHLQPDEAARLIDPYVYGEREGAPGAVSMIEGALTVRETRDNLDRIEDVLAEFDRPRPATRLHFQLIEADGFTGSDPAIAEVVSELEKIFRFGGYRLAGEAFVSATDRSEIHQRLRASGEDYEIAGRVLQLSPGTMRLQEVALFGAETGQLLSTTVNVRTGQTLVLGSSPKAGTSTTLLLTVRAEEVPAGS